MSASVGWGGGRVGQPLPQLVLLVGKQVSEGGLAGRQGGGRTGKEGAD